MDLMRSLFVENDHGIDRSDRRYHFGSFGFRDNRAPLALDGPHRPVGVDGNDERIAVPARVLQISDMTRVQDVEHTVGEHNALAALTQLCDPGTRLVWGQYGQTEARNHFAPNIHVG